MADISYEFGALTIGIDIPFITFPKTSISVDYIVPVTPSLAVGASLSMTGSPGNVAFELAAKAKLLRLFELEYTIHTWNLFSPNGVVPGAPTLPPFPLPPAPEPDILTPESWLLEFDEPGTLWVYVCTSEGCSVSIYQILPGYSFGGVGSVDNICSRDEYDNLVLGEDFVFNGVLTGSYICREGSDGTGNVRPRPAQSVGTLFIPANKFSVPRIGTQPKGADMSCTCGEIQAMLDARFALLSEQIFDRLNCIAEDVRSLRIGFFGDVQTSVASYGLSGVGQTPPLPGDVVELLVTPIGLPVGQEQWLTDPKLFSLGILIPIFEDGAYGSPLTLIAPFGNSLRLPVSLAGIRRFYWFLYPNVTVSMTVKWQTGANVENSGWCDY